MTDHQDEVNKSVEEQNAKDGYTPAIVEIMLNSEKILKASEQLLRDTEALRRQLNA